MKPSIPITFILINELELVPLFWDSGEAYRDHYSLLVPLWSGEISPHWCAIGQMYIRTCVYMSLLMQRSAF